MFIAFIYLYIILFIYYINIQRAPKNFGRYKQGVSPAPADNGVEDDIETALHKLRKMRTNNLVQLGWGAEYTPFSERERQVQNGTGNRRGYNSEVKSRKSSSKKHPSQTGETNRRSRSAKRTTASQSNLARTSWRPGGRNLNKYGRDRLGASDGIRNKKSSEPSVKTRKANQKGLKKKSSKQSSKRSKSVKKSCQRHDTYVHKSARQQRERAALASVRLKNLQKSSLKPVLVQ